jgi:hypothetical protein
LPIPQLILVLPNETLGKKELEKIGSKKDELTTTFARK